VRGEHDERPARADLRAWAGTVLGELDELRDRLAKAEQGRDVLQREVDALRDRRNELADARSVEQVKAYEAVRAAYEAAESERNHYAHDNRRLRERLALAHGHRDEWRALCVESGGECDALRAELADRRSKSVGLDEALQVSEALDNERAARVRLEHEIAGLHGARDGAVAALDAAKAENVRLTDALNARDDYVLLRLRDGRPELLTVSNWEETGPTPAGGVTVTVEGYRAGEVATNDVDV
jgi:chromosome segregation ATPase